MARSGDRSTDEVDTTRAAAGTQRLRAAIDRGETADKVAFDDPAAAPLGTDDEAAGRPPSPAAVTQALRHEAKPHLADAHGGRAPDHKGERSAGPILIGVTIALLLLGAVGLWLLR